MPPHPLPIPFTGRLLVVLTEQAVDRIVDWTLLPVAADLPDLGALADAVDFPSIRTALAQAGLPPSPRAVSSLSLSQILKLDEEASTGPYPLSHRVAAYWIVDTGGDEPTTTRLMAALRQAPEVAAVYREQAVGPPPAGMPAPINEPFLDSQDHLDPAPGGVDARWVWEHLGLHGAGIDFADVEMGWNLGHEDLAGKAPIRLTPPAWNNPEWEDHGTAVLGLVGGGANGKGIAGVAPGVNSIRVVSHWDGSVSTKVGDAIATATAALTYGDVLLVEAQTEDNWPIEILNGDFELNMMRAAGNKGIIVVEPAGNGGKKMDNWITNWSGPYDSGAIMVGASVGNPPPPGFGTVPHAPLPTANVSARIDCFAPGAGLVSTGYGDLSNLGPNATYTKSFGETSGASAVIAGVAVLVQHMHIAACGARLGSVEMRELLSEPQHGTLQGAPDPGNIGTMPDLCRIARAMNDIYLRDHAGDTGDVPSTGPLASSPDIIVVPVAPPDPVAAYGEGSGHEDSTTLSEPVTAGHDHQVYVRVRNRGICRANVVEATVYWSEVATLVTPASWHLIGRSPPFPVPPGDALTVSPAIPWLAAQIPAPGHYCFVAEVHTPYDPAVAPPGPTDWNGFLDYIRRVNNVTWRNLNVVAPEELSPAQGLWFWIRGAPDRARRFDLEILQRVPTGARLLLDLPLALLPMLDAPLVIERRELGGQPRVLVELPRSPTLRLPAIRLARNAAHRCRLVLVPGRGSEEDRLDVIIGSLAIRQLYENEEVGRITWLVRQPRRDGR